MTLAVLSLRALHARLKEFLDGLCRKVHDWRCVCLNRGQGEEWTGDIVCSALAVINVCVDFREVRKIVSVQGM